MHVVLLGVEIR